MRSNELSFGISAETENSETTLNRSLGMKHLVAYGLVYISPIVPLTTFGFVWGASGGLIALAYLLGATCMYFTAKSYATMSSVVTSAGSIYGYAKYALGDFWGFISGWLLLLDYLMIPALVFTLMSVGFQTLMPDISRPAWIVILVSVTFMINWFGVVITSRVSIVSVVAQFLIVAGVLVFIVLALADGKGNGSLTFAPFYDDHTFNLGNVFSATSICILSFLGFDSISTLSEEVQSRDKNLIGKAIIRVLLISASTFILVAWVVGNVVPGMEIVNPEAAIFEITGQQIGSWAPVTLAWLFALAAGFTNTLPMMAGASRVLFSMGRDRQLPPILARIHDKHQTPYIAMIFTSALALVIALVMVDRIDLLASFVNFGALSAFLMLHISVFYRLGIKNPDRKLFPHIIVPILGIIIVSVVLLNLDKDALFIGVIWLVIGVLYGFKLMREGKSELNI